MEELNDFSLGGDTDDDEVGSTPARHVGGLPPHLITSTPAVAAGIGDGHRLTETPIGLGAQENADGLEAKFLNAS